MLHAANAIEQGYKQVMLRANDTADIVVLAISFLDETGADNPWIVFVMKK